MERFWKWLTQFDARRFMQGAIVGGVLAVALAITLGIMGVRLSQAEANEVSSLSQPSASTLPDVPRLPDMRYQKDVNQLYSSPVLKAWNDQRLAALDAARKASTTPVTSPIKAPVKKLPPVKKKRPAALARVRYAGAMQNTSGIRMALVDDLKAKTTHILQPGDRLYGWRVQAVTQSKIVFQHAEEDEQIVLQGNTIALGIKE